MFSRVLAKSLITKQQPLQRVISSPINILRPYTTTKAESQKLFNDINTFWFGGKFTPFESPPPLWQKHTFV